MWMWLVTAALLTISNVFMTFAWYGHLKFKASALWVAILASWLIALVEYCFQVPANRIGHNAGLATAQLKTIQEVITLTVFCLFSVWYLKEPIKWNYVAGFALVACGALFVFAPWQQHTKAGAAEIRVEQPPTAAVLASPSSLQANRKADDSAQIFTAS